MKAPVRTQQWVARRGLLYFQSRESVYMTTEVAKPVEQTASVDPAATSQPDPDEGYDPQWVSKMTPRQQKDVDAFVASRVDPWKTKHSDAEAELGRIKRHANLDAATLADLRDSDKQFELTKNLALRFGVPAKRIERAENLRDLNLLLADYEPEAKGKSVGQDTGGDSASLFAQFQTWLQAQNGKEPAPAKREPLALNGSQRSIREPTLAELNKVDTRLLTPKQLREHGALVDAAIKRQYGMSV